eukprot:s1201_g6.t1
MASSCLAFFCFLGNIIGTKDGLNTSCHKGTKLLQNGRKAERDPETGILRSQALPLLKEPSVHSHEPYPQAVSRTPRPDPGCSLGKCSTKVLLE